MRTAVGEAMVRAAFDAGAPGPGEVTVAVAGCGVCHTLDRRNQPSAKIVRKRPGHAGWPPAPANISNQKFEPVGIPKDSVSSENALADYSTVIEGATGWGLTDRWKPANIIAEELTSGGSDP